MRVNSTDLQNAFGKYLALVDKEDIIVVKNGKSVARISHYVEPDFYIVHEEAKDYKTYRKVSYEEYMALVEASDQRYELIGGEVYLLAAPSFQHQVAVNEIAGVFYYYFKGTSCRSLTSPIDIRLFGFATKFEEDPNVVQPDVVVICDTDNIEDGKYLGVPKLVVEVLSPSTKGKDMATKLHLYMKSGVSEYWVVDLDEKSVSQYSFTEDRDIEEIRMYQEKETVKSSAFPGLEMPVNSVLE